VGNVRFLDNLIIPQENRECFPIFILTIFPIAKQFKNLEFDIYAPVITGQLGLGKLSVFTV